MKILIVEDEPSLRELMQKTLVKERYVVETASTFHEASLKIADYSYDCILLDIMLPDGNGLKLLEMLKEQQKRKASSSSQPAIPSRTRSWGWNRERTTTFRNPSTWPS
mgnify:CR=1 FL=1